MDDKTLASLGNDPDDASRFKKELTYRKRFVTLKKKLEGHLDEFGEGKEPSKKGKAILMELKDIFTFYKICRYMEMERSDLDPRVQELIYIAGEV